MLYVLDDALTEAERVAARDYFVGLGGSAKLAWADGSFKDIVAYKSPLSKILQLANSCIDLSTMVGCEYWSNLNEKTGWHKDTDETVLYRDGVERFPICSCVYYPEINVSIGGDLLFETMRVKPITNRLVVFSPNMLHTVEDFLGNRLSIAINPWDYKLESACQLE
jgi:hypothetical protein